MSAVIEKLLKIQTNPINFIPHIVEAYSNPDGKIKDNGIPANHFKMSGAFFTEILYYELAERKKTSPLGSLDDTKMSLIYEWAVVFAGIIESLNNGFFAITAKQVDEPLPSDDFYPKTVRGIMDRLDEHLKAHTYLVGDEVTLADISVFTQLIPLYSGLLNESFRSEYPHSTRWFDLIWHQPNVNSVLGEKIKLCESTKFEYLATYVPPSPFTFLEWKTLYSREDASFSTKWFWENFDPGNFSIYKMVYNYPEDLTQIFMSKNLVIGFCQRIENAAKDSFGCILVLGKDGNNHIRGYFVFRGHSIPKNIQMAADYPSFTFTEVDHTDEKVVKEMNDYLSWKDTVEGLQFADAKIFQ